MIKISIKKLLLLSGMAFFSISQAAQPAKARVNPRRTLTPKERQQQLQALEKLNTEFITIATLFPEFLIEVYRVERMIKRGEITQQQAEQAFAELAKKFSQEMLKEAQESTIGGVSSQETQLLKNKK